MSTSNLTIIARLSGPPIHRLSDDVLYQIFLLCSSNWFDNPEYYIGSRGERNAAFGVCHRWKTIITMAPHYWSLIRVDKTMMPVLAQAHIDRSGSIPLQILFCTRHQLQGVWPSRKPPDDSLHPFIAVARVLATQARRIKSFRVLGLDRYQLIRNIMDIFSEPAPQLQTLVFEHCHLPIQEEIELMDTPFGASFPLLRVLRAHEAFMSWASCMELRNLTTLQFGFEFEWGEPRRDLTSVLQGCPHLRVLDLRISDGVGFATSGPPAMEDDVDDSEEDIIEFPELQELRINACHGSGLMGFLSHLIFPPSVSLHLVLRSSDHWMSQGLGKGGLLRDLVTHSKSARAIVGSSGTFTLITGPQMNMTIDWIADSQLWEVYSVFMDVRFDTLESLDLTMVDTTTVSPGYTEELVYALTNNLAAIQTLTSLSVRYQSSSDMGHRRFWTELWGEAEDSALEANLKVSSLRVSCVRYNVFVALLELAAWIRTQFEQFEDRCSLKHVEVYAHVDEVTEDAVRIENLGFDKFERWGCEVVINDCAELHNLDIVKPSEL